MAGKARSFAPTLSVFKKLDQPKESKEVAQDAQKVVESTPIVSKYCSRCETKIGTNCIARDCKCATITPTICIRCLAEDLEKEQLDRPLNHDEEFLEWR